MCLLRGTDCDLWTDEWPLACVRECSRTFSPVALSVVGEDVRRTQSRLKPYAGWVPIQARRLTVGPNVVVNVTVGWMFVH
jgi:hypothetical protein